MAYIVATRRNGRWRICAARHGFMATGGISGGTLRKHWASLRWSTSTSCSCIFIQCPSNIMFPMVVNNHACTRDITLFGHWIMLNIVFDLQQKLLACCWSMHAMVCICLYGTRTRLLQVVHNVHNVDCNRNIQGLTYIATQKIVFHSWRRDFFRYGHSIVQEDFCGFRADCCMVSPLSLLFTVLYKTAFSKK